MSQHKSGKKKIVKTTSSIKPTSSRIKSTASRKVQELPLLFKRENYMIFGMGAVLVAAGLLLMAGGRMPSPDVWDENLIYSFRRITLAPITILAGLGLVIYGIFKKG